nr:ATP synthase 8 [Antarctophthirus microchir]
MPQLFPSYWVICGALFSFLFLTFTVTLHFMMCLKAKPSPTVSPFTQPISSISFHYLLND